MLGVRSARSPARPASISFCSDASRGSSKRSESAASNASAKASAPPSFAMTADAILPTRDRSATPTKTATTYGPHVKSAGQCSALPAIIAPIVTIGRTQAIAAYAPSARFSPFSAAHTSNAMAFSGSRRTPLPATKSARASSGFFASARAAPCRARISSSAGGSCAASSQARSVRAPGCVRANETNDVTLRSPIMSRSIAYGCAASGPSAGSCGSSGGDCDPLCSSPRPSARS